MLTVAHIASGKLSKNNNEVGAAQFNDRAIL